MNTRLITQCAWCRDVKVSGRYTALGFKTLVHEIDLPARNGKAVHFAVTHGICPQCSERVLGHSPAG